MIDTLINLTIPIISKVTISILDDVFGQNSQFEQMITQLNQLHCNVEFSKTTTESRFRFNVEFSRTTTKTKFNKVDTEKRHQLENSRKTIGRELKQINEDKFKNFVSEAKTLINSISDQMPMAIAELFDSYDKQFRERLDNIIKEQQQIALDQLKQEKAKAEKLRQLEHNRETVEEELKKPEYIIGQLL